MGSEMCIRDRFGVASGVAVAGAARRPAAADAELPPPGLAPHHPPLHPHPCLLYTSDAADERSSVDLGGRRIIKKKNNYPS